VAIEKVYQFRMWTFNDKIEAESFEQDLFGEQDCALTLFHFLRNGKRFAGATETNNRRTMLSGPIREISTPDIFA
jgi:hypothetical protein